MYAVLISIGIVSTVITIAGLYRSGSAAIPAWPMLFSPGPLSTKHNFLAGKCETCHTPTRGIQAKTCIACHATAAGDLGKQPTAFHGYIQDCRGCHIEHQGENRPTKMDHEALLWIGAQLASEPTNRPGLQNQLVTDMAAFLGMRIRQSTNENLSCASCHSNQDPHRALFGSSCSSCHETTTWRIAAFLHPSPRSHDCAQCHQAPPSHYMEHFGMISKAVSGQEHAQVKQCFLCHRTNSFNDIKGVGWYKHH